MRKENSMTRYAQVRTALSPIEGLKRGRTLTANAVVFGSEQR